MGRRARSTVRRVVVGLLMLATMFVYAASSHAVLMPQPSTLQITTELNDPTVAVATVSDHEQSGEQALCDDDHTPLDDGLCCMVAHCATMHSGLLASAVEIFIPRLGRERQQPGLVSPEGIGTVPALRPPL
ncbi:hypothetical protein [Azospirillum doebereinerae]